LGENSLEQSKIISTAMKVHYVSNLNTYIVDQNGELVYQHELISIPAFMPGANKKDVLYLFKEIKEGEEKLYSYTNEWGLHYFGYSFSVKKEGYTVIIGPYLETSPNVFSLSREYTLNSIESEDLKAVCNKMYVLTAEQASSYASVLQQFKSMMVTETTPRIISTFKKEGPIYKKSENITLDEEAELVKIRYKTEKDFMHAVEQGDKTEALKLINSRNMLFYFSERFPNQPLRTQRNVAIVLNTLLRVSARNSHVPSIIIHRISEKYAYEIENANQVETLHQLKDMMIAEYCDLVLEYTLRNYSTLTQRIIEHLLSFYDKQINKEELAQLLSAHPSHLSRKFKEETKMTITAYQQMLRLKKAKHLLKTENLSIEEIAWIIGYDDPSYFARVFKKETGKTPSQYRDGEEQ
jgi:AraC-like DNA-binding protein